MALSVTRKTKDLGLVQFNLSGFISLGKLVSNWCTSFSPIK